MCIHVSSSENSYKSHGTEWWLVNAIALCVIAFSPLRHYLLHRGDFGRTSAVPEDERPLADAAGTAGATTGGACGGGAGGVGDGPKYTNQSERPHATTTQDEQLDRQPLE